MVKEHQDWIDEQEKLKLLAAKEDAKLDKKVKKYGKAKG
jgi:hypothetical protein